MNEIEVYINITDDDINEAEQFFVVNLRIEDALLHGHVQLSRRPSVLARIVDDDRKCNQLESSECTLDCFMSIIWVIGRENFVTTE